MPLVDWNGNGRIDPSDVAISLAVEEEQREEGIFPELRNHSGRDEADDDEDEE